MVDIGDKVNWARVPRGGYGYVQSVAGRVLHVGEHRATIAVMPQHGVIQRKRVSLDKLSIRERHVPELDGVFLNKLRGVENVR